MLLVPLNAASAAKSASAACAPIAVRAAAASTAVMTARPTVVVSITCVDKKATMLIRF